MDCREYQMQISLFVDGELDEARVRALREHLALCPDCHRAFERVSALNGRVHSYRSLRPRPGLAQRVKDRVAAERNRADQRTSLPVWSRVPLAAMIVLLAIGLGNLAGQSMTEILWSEQSGDILEWVAPESSQSFADFVIEIGLKENDR